MQKFEATDAVQNIKAKQPGILVCPTNKIVVIGIMKIRILYETPKKTFGLVFWEINLLNLFPNQNPTDDIFVDLLQNTENTKEPLIVSKTIVVIR